ncbi:MAG: hypothetical protein EKK57_04840 [Proteobacteria bacterium]|nr:MAG: hypothetical protein EKK57_04840 [Pseudomonadota bacterium]
MWIREKSYFRWDGPELTTEEILALPSPVSTEIQEAYDVTMFNAVVSFINRLIFNDRIISLVREVTKLEPTKENIISELKTNQALYDIFFKQMIVNQAWPKWYHDTLYAPCLIRELR